MFTSMLVSLMFAAPDADLPQAPRANTVPITAANLRSKYISPDGTFQIVLKSEEEGIVELVETQTGESRAIRVLHEYRDTKGVARTFAHVGSAAVAAEDPHVALLNRAGRIEIRNWRTGELVKGIAIEGRTVEILGVGRQEMVLSRDGAYLTLCFPEIRSAFDPVDKSWGYGAVFDLGGGDEKHFVRGLIGAAGVRDGRLLGAVQNAAEKTLKLWDLRGNRPIRDLGDKHDAQYRRAAFSQDGRYLAAVGVDKTNLQIWDTETGDEKLSQPLGAAEVERGLTFSPSNRFIVLTATDRARGATALVRAWDISTGRLIWSKTKNLHIAGDPFVLPDAARVAVGLQKIGGDASFGIWNGCNRPPANTLHSLRDSGNPVFRIVSR